MEEELKEAIGIVEEMLEETKIKNIKILLPVEERAIENILNRLEQLEQENKELKEAKKSMREKLHNAHRAWVKWERKAIQAKQVFEQKKTECKQLTKVLGEKNRKIKELEQDERVIEEAVKILGEHRHYSVPDEEQNALNEEIVDKAYELLKDRKCG